MRRLATLTAAAAFALAVGFGAPAKADFEFLFDSGQLVGYWHFDTNSGTNPALDGSVNSNNGTLTNSATRSTDIPDIVSNVNSLDLTGGSNALVSIGDPSPLQITSGDMTITAWVNPSATGTIDHIFTRRNSGCGVLGYQLQMNASNQLTWSDGGGQRLSGLTVPDDDWSFVAVVYNSAGPTVDFFVNGSSATGVAAGALGSPGATVDVQIGQANGCGNLTHFDGLIDEVRIYDVALPAGDIQTLAHIFPGTVEKELVSGPNDNDGDPIDVDVDPFDAGGVLVLSPDSQHFEYKITITNDGEDGAIDGLKIFDVVGAEFDPDCDAEDDPIDGFPTDANCPDNGNDGIAVVGDCTASITPHDVGRKLDPHFITVEVIALDNGESCMVTVWVKTDENPSSVRKTGEGDGSDPKEKFSPTSCDLVMAPDLFNTFTLNEGLKVFDPDSGIRLLGPVDSLQLTCNFP